MRSVRNRLRVRTGALIVAILTGAAFAQETPKAAETQTQPTSAATRPAASQPATFQAHATLGPVLPIPETVINGRKVCSRDVCGPVWDGVNNGLWIVLSDRTGQGGPGRARSTALLIDPASGQEKTRLDVPGEGLIAHDGVGLWFAVPDPATSTIAFQRIRTAQEGTRDRAKDNRLPEDLPSVIPLAEFRITSQEVSPGVFSPYSVLESSQTEATFLSQWHFDSRVVHVYGKWTSQWNDETIPRAVGAGHLWLHAGSLKRFSLAHLSPIPATGRAFPPDWQLTVGHDRDLQPQIENLPADNSVRQANDWLAWDGQHLWSLHTDRIEAGEKKDVSRTGESQDPPPPHDGNPVLVPPVRLISIDVGLTRKPDTTERHNKALAFERKNGTLKAIPLFEQIIADDPAAAEVRNHLGWALATRPQEPYHDIQRAKKLVETALEWQPWDPEKWDTLAEIYWRLGDAKLAEHLEAKAINLNPSKTFYWKQLDKFRAGPTTQEAPEPAY